jgi:OmcA/MtrC family decaheme c-type cytochrome
MQGGAEGSIVDSHRNRTNELIAEFKINVLDVQNTALGQFPIVTLSVTNPLNGDDPYDILNDPEFNGGRLNVGLAWDTADYNNVGNGGVNSRYQVTNALTNAVAVGDGTFTLVLGTQIPDGTLAPFVATSGSGAIIVEGRGRKDISLTSTPNISNIPITFGIGYFSIDESDGVAVPRRQSVTIEKCNVCHEIKINHGGNRTNDTQGCIGCHNPRNTDKVVRDIAVNPPTDGKDEESIDFKRLIHGVHASAFRENPLQVVGFGGFSTHVFDEEEVHFPGDLSNCRTCHVEGAWRLPMADGVLASTIDTGADIADPADDLMITPTSAVCSSCHDGGLEQAHMEQNGGDFTATEASIAGGASTETCSICHGRGSVADLDVVHGLD